MQKDIDVENIKKALKDKDTREKFLLFLLSDVIPKNISQFKEVKIVATLRDQKTNRLKESIMKIYKDNKQIKIKSTNTTYADLTFSLLPILYASINATFKDMKSTTDELLKAIVDGRLEKFIEEVKSYGKAEKK